MNRNDWVFVGTRLLGLYLIVQAVMSIPGVLMFLSSELGPHAGVPPLTCGLQWLMGTLLFLGAPHLTRWLERRDPLS